MTAPDAAKVVITAALDRDTLQLALDALREEAQRRRDVAVRLSGELRRQKAAGEVKDIRTGAVKVTELLGEADALEQLVAELDPAQPAEPPAPADAEDPGGDPYLCPACAAGRCEDHDDDTVEGKACRCPNCFDEAAPPASDAPTLPLDPAKDPDVIAARAAMAGQ